LCGAVGVAGKVRAEERDAATAEDAFGVEAGDSCLKDVFAHADGLGMVNELVVATAVGPAGPTAVPDGVPGSRRSPNIWEISGSRIDY